MMVTLCTQIIVKYQDQITLYCKGAGELLRLAGIRAYVGMGSVSATKRLRVGGVGGE